jgi:hypothetical protein
MAAPVGGYVLRDTECTFDGTDYANQLSKIQFTPDTPIQTMRTLVPDGIVQDIDSAVWTLELSGIQDHVTAQGFCAYLVANAGDTVTVVYTPKPGGPAMTADVILMAVPFGGEQGAFTSFEVTLPVVGTPAIA